MLRFALGSSAFFLFAVACTAGGPDSTGTTPSSSGGSSSGGSECGGPSPTTTLAAATTADRATICDCTVALQGGYGMSFPCDGGITFSNKKDQAACLSSWPACTNATVGDLIACTHAVIEHDRCDVNAALKDPRCLFLTGCKT